MIATLEQQPELFTPRPPAGEMNWLEKLLFERKGWMTARAIQLATQGSAIDRDIRQVASDSCKIISGQKGYKHLAHATAEEVNHAANWLESQAKKMSERACALRREAHKLFG